MAVLAQGDEADRPIGMDRPVFRMHLLRKLYVQVLLAVIAGVALLLSKFLRPKESR